MESFIVLNIIFVLTVFLLATFAVFAIGFILGFKIEDKTILKKKEEFESKRNKENEQEKKAKKEWKKFLEYDGSTPTGVE